MSTKTLPILFLNLGGEMLYILDQRLRAQSIPQEKAQKVLHDIIGSMFNKRFMDELFKPQDAYSKKAMRTVFDRLAHASIMRLNSASMDKLYDLMTMALKYQVLLSMSPRDILLITLNHMDAVRKFVAGNDHVMEQVNNVYKLLYQNYACLSLAQFQLIRQSLLSFLQDLHIRVSIFLKDKVQNTNGKFVLPTDGAVPFSSEVPGTIRYYDENGKVYKTNEFSSNCKHHLSDKQGSFELFGDRVITLGTNMYTASRPVETSPPKTVSQETSRSGSMTTLTEAESTENPNPIAKAELNLLAHLMGGNTDKPSANKGNTFRLNLFNTDEEEQQAEVHRVKKHSGNVITVDATKTKQHNELSKLMSEFSIDESSSAGSKGDDLLELMDST
ncbi:protein OSCP1-like [Dendronephthya gigantea]|uniref:protein OSCP1-like n=1 Tax=Dendronephthya gigantea TaxID=151771 RepID=UPI00106CA250|nr:protein OSCP1-like [Dendronephthya gigantea]